MTPKYNWVAVYSDGSRFPQYNEDGSDNRYQDIDRERLVIFEFWKTTYEKVLDGSGNPKFNATRRLLIACDLSTGARLIYRRRVEQVCGGNSLAVYLIGWQRTIEGKNSQSVVCIPEYSDTMVFIDGWRDGSRWLYPIEELPFEK
jgi:hypothetical protein